MANEFRIKKGLIVNETDLYVSGSKTGIGTTTPSEKLHIVNSSSAHLVSKLEQDNVDYQAWFEANSQDGGYARFGIGDNGNDFAFWNTSEASYKWFISGEKMTLNSDGYLGIGTNVPWTLLTLGADPMSGSLNAGVALAFEGTNFAEYGYRFKANGANYYQVLYNGSAINWKDYSGGSYLTRMSLTNAGNLGIGTTNPGDTLHVDGNVRFVNSGFAGFEAHNTNGTWESFIGTETGGGGNRYNAASSQHTFYNNSTAVMRINSSGNVGIGTTSPSVTLQVEGSGGSVMGSSDVLSYFKRSTGNTYLGIDTSVAGDDAGIRFGHGGTKTWTLLSYKSSTTDGFAFFDHSSSSFPLILREGGNIGIGTTVPSTLLSLGNNVDAQKVLLYDNNDNFKYGFGIQNNEFRQFFPDSTSARLVFGTISDSDGTTFSEKMRIDSSGNVGIGTTNPTSYGSAARTLEVRGNTGTGTGLVRVSNADNSVGTSLYSGTGAGTLIVQTNHPLTFATNNNEKMRIDTSGNVGIGTSNPSSNLHISGSSEAVFKIQSNRNDIRLLEEDTTDTNSLIRHQTGLLRFDTISDNELTITTRVALDHSTGYFGIGTINPSAKLHVDGDAIITGKVTAQEFNTEFVSASIIYQSGSTKFGDTLDDTHSFTGSLEISGSGVLNTHIGTPSSPYQSDDQFIKLVSPDGSTGTLVNADNGNTWLNADGGKDLWLNWYSLNSPTSNTDLQVGDGEGGNAILTVQGSTSRVGIGTMSPSALLNVGSAGTLHFTESGIGSMLLKGTSGTARGMFEVHNADGASKALLQAYNGGASVGTLSKTNLDIITSGSTRMTISGSNGYVGIGTPNPNAPLEVIGSSNEVLRLHKTSGGSYQLVMSTTFTSGNAFGISPFINGVSNGGFSITDITNNTERLVIQNSTGNVGIGTNSPASKLTINGGINNVWSYSTSTTDQPGFVAANNVDSISQTSLLYAKIYGSGIAASGFGVTLGNYGVVATDGSANNGLLLGTLNAKPLIIGTNGAERMRIDSTGDVGIGTTNPSHKLHVKDVNVDIKTEATTGAARNILKSSTGEWRLGTNAVQSNNFWIYEPTLAEYVFNISTAGNVGIGTTSPSYKFHVKGASAGTGDGNQIASIGNTNGGTQLAFGSYEDNYNWIRSYESGIGGRDLVFVASSETMRITSDGDVGIGTTSPSAKLHIQESSLDNPSIFLGRYNNAASPLLQIGESDFFGSAGSFGEVLFHTFNRDIVFSTSAVSSSFSTIDTAAMVIEKDEGNIGIGTTSPYSNVTLEYTGNNTAGTYFGNLVLNATDVSTWNRLRFDRSGVARFGVALSNQDKFVISNLYTNGTTADPDDTAFVMLQNSNVGIGTNSPSQKLTVAGTISGSSDLSIDGDSVFDGTVGYNTFNSGFGGNGWRIDSNANAEFQNLTVRGTFSVYELLAQQIRATNGSLLVATSGKVESTGSLTLFFDTGSQYGHGFLPGDVLLAQRLDPAGGQLKRTFLTVNTVSSTGSLIYKDLSGNTPEAGQEFVRIGSTSSLDRQGHIYLTADDSNAPYIGVRDGLSGSVQFTSGTGSIEKVRVGRLDGITSNTFGSLNGYGFWATGNAYLEGGISATFGDIGGFSITDSAISSSNNNLILRSNGDITGSSVLFNGGTIGGFTISGDALTGNNFYLSGSATGNEFFISASNFNVKANGDLTGSRVLLDGGQIVNFPDVTTLYDRKGNIAKYGDFDLDGDIDRDDGIDVLKYTVSAYSASAYQFFLGDVTDNGDVTALDASYIFAFATGSGNSGSAGQNAVDTGDPFFTDVKLEINTSGSFLYGSGQPRSNSGGYDDRELFFQLGPMYSRFNTVYSGVVAADNLSAETAKLGLVSSLHVEDTTAMTSGQSSVEVLKLERRDYGGDIKATTEGHISMWATDSSDNNEWARISWLNDNTSDSGAENEGSLHFWTNTAGTLTRQMMIDHDGNVGIGTTNPTSNLVVEGSGSTIFDVQGSLGQLFSVTDDLTGTLFSVNDISGIPILTVDSDDTVTMGTFGENTLVVTGSRVGIGTTSPAGLLSLSKGTRTLDIKLETAPVSGDVGVQLRAGGGDYLGLAAGGGSSVGLVVDSSNNVGIGTASPLTKLHVDGAITINTGTGGVFNDLNIGGINGWADSEAHRINFVYGNGTSNIFQTIESYYGGVNEGKMRFRNFYTNSAQTEILMTIHSNGNVGIGTDSPGSALHVAGPIDTAPSGDGVHIGKYSSGGNTYGHIQLQGNAGGYIDFSTSGTDWKGRILYSNDSNYLRFDTNSDERMRIDSSGNVGIGTTSPLTKLHIEGANNNDTEDYAQLYIKGTGTYPLDMVGIVLDSAGSNQSHLRFSNNGSPKFQIRYNNGDTADDKLKFYSWTQGADIVTFDGGTGNVGIGTVSPNQPLHLVGNTLKIESDGSNAAGAVLELKHANNNSTDVCGTINLTNNVGGYAAIEGGTTGANNTGYIAFKTDNAGTQGEKMRILGDGNVGIGTTSPAEKLHIEGNIEAGNHSGIYSFLDTITTTSSEDIFSITNQHGVQAFRVTFVCSTSGYSVAKTYEVVHQFGAPPVFFKVVDTGPYSSEDFDVSFTNTGGDTGVLCSITNNSTTINANIVTTVFLGGSPTGITITEL